MRTNDVIIRSSDPKDEVSILLVESSGDEVFLTVFDYEEGFDFRSMTSGKCIGVKTEALIDALMASGAAAEIHALIHKVD